uniref:5-aminolevulinate synthase (Delta-ALA synthase) (Delta-aminolevulinate synthase)) n=1 Tax=Ganoderma boninense TaxID=34458 RepID=A0A5K1K8C7_9APHY|nr:5-aminolevulinate synthase (EC (5-aminolevulinic acid synthase) (Delta-ALA synthase) (Delta-aminolevulinate synthase) [Ganoderma boninense]
MGSAAMGMIITADGTLTVLLTIVLHRSRTGLKSTDSMLNILIMYTINTVYSNDAEPELGAVYANSMLAVLNSRHFLSNYGKPDYDCSPSNISAIHRSALTGLWFKWPSQRETPAF